MTAITLKRVDQQRNMSRFYKLDVRPTLLGGWSLTRDDAALAAQGIDAAVLADPMTLSD